MSENRFQVQSTLSIRIFPEAYRAKGPTTVPLSIIDNTVATFAPCAAAWFFKSQGTRSAPSPAHWKASLSQTLTDYPQWCGHLAWTDPVSHDTNNHNNRFSRVHVTFNSPTTDPGALLVTAESPKKLEDFIPSHSARRASLKAWDASEVRTLDLLPSEKLAPTKDSAKNAPALMVQITSFACGGLAIAIMSAHCLSDAHGLSKFVKDWSNISHALLLSKPPPRLRPVFDPQMLDSRALGDIDAAAPDPEIQEEARKLPLHRFDWYTPVDGQPWPVSLPVGYDPKAKLSQSDPLPWADWDPSDSCAYRVLHFTSSEIQNLYNLASSTGTKISKHDALLAHIWSVVNRARAATNSPDDTVYLDLTFGLRPRVSPPLPDSFLGSPIMLTAIPSTSVETTSTASLPNLASQIRGALQRFTPSAIAAHLHDAAFEYAPQRLWQAFLGRKHILLTTWLHLDLWSLDFGLEELLHMQPVMPFMDGIVNVVEANGPESGHWSSNGVDVHIYLTTQSMDRLIQDPMLWGGIFGKESSGKLSVT